MTYRYNISYYVLSHDQSSVKPDNLVRLNLDAIYFYQECDPVLCRFIQCLDNQLFGMSCMESGEDIHLERTIGCQPSVVRFDTTTASSWPK